MLTNKCKACHQATSQWYRFAYALFLLTFPIPYMSVAEIECAATAPFQWIVVLQVIFEGWAFTDLNPIALMVNEPKGLEDLELSTLSPMIIPIIFSMLFLF